VTEALLRAIDEKLDGVVARVDGVIARVDAVETRLDAKLDRVIARVDGLDEKLDRVIVRVDGLDAKLDRVIVRVDGLETRLPAVDLTLLMRQTQRLVADVADMRDTMMVNGAILLRLEAGQRVLESRFDRLVNRVRALEEDPGPPPSPQ
jgi:hypothetical protein